MIEKKWIYKITNLINGKIYIGQSKDLRKRWQEHCRLGKNPQRNTYLYQAINKHGKKNFKIEVIEGPIENYNQREKYWISYYNSCNREKGYNLTIGGDDPPIITGEDSSLSVYSDTLVEKLQNLLLYSDKSYKEISQKLNVPKTYVSLINRGIIRIKDSLNYPLRQQSNQRTNKEIVENIILNLLYTTNSVVSLSKKYNISRLTIDRVNRGEHHYCPKTIKYPIRQLNEKLSYLILNNIFQDLQSNELKLSDIEKKYNLSKSTINRINQGRTYKRKNKQYPIRSSKQRVYN